MTLTRLLSLNYFWLLVLRRCSFSAGSMFMPTSLSNCQSGVFLTSDADSHPISWLSVCGISYFLVGSWRALWKAWMKSAGKERSIWAISNTDAVNHLPSLTTSSLFGLLLGVCSNVILSSTVIYPEEKSKDIFKPSFTGTVVNLQSAITSGGFLDMGLSGRMCTKKKKKTHTLWEMKAMQHLHM